jgi:hypothetical protein
MILPVAEQLWKFSGVHLYLEKKNTIQRYMSLKLTVKIKVSEIYTEPQMNLKSVTKIELTC